MGLNKRLIYQAGGAAGVTNTDNFAPVLYTGNGGTQSITSLDFQPDLVWIKNRDTTEHNILIDVIRQNDTGKFLSSNLTAAPFNTTQPTFNSSGFTAYNLQRVSNTRYLLAMNASGSGSFNIIRIDKQSQPPKAPKELAIAVASGKATLTWTAGDNTETGYDDTHAFLKIWNSQETIELIRKADIVYAHYFLSSSREQAKVASELSYLEEKHKQFFPNNDKILEMLQKFAESENEYKQELRMF